MNLRRIFLTRATLGVALAVGLILLPTSSASAQTLNPTTNPPSGLAGVNDSIITGGGFPAGTITGATVSFASSCGGAIVATTPVTQVTSVLSSRRFAFGIPSSLKTGTYYVSVAGTAGSTPFNTAGSSCSQIQVTATSTTIASCVPTSSLAVVAGTNVNAYVPFGAWDFGKAGIEEVPLEGTGTAQNFATSGNVNSCAANSTTDEVICTENGTNVDLINGSVLTTIKSGANAFAEFSGGSCENCGVAINAANNTALIAMGYTGGGAGPFGGESGVQVLNLSNNTFNTPVGLSHFVSEDISIDSGRNLVLSPGEGGWYDLLQIGSNNSLTEYGFNIYSAGKGVTYPYLDSAAEDCTTGIAMASDEESDGVFLADLTQATFTPGTPGTWTAPSQFFNLSDGGYAAGTTGLSEAPGTNHLGVVTGEFGGQTYAILQLPSTSGSGTPALTDWAYVGSMPNTPDGNYFEAGYDPHTITAYTSPNTSKSYAVIADWDAGYPNYLAVIDMSCVLALPRTTGHTVNGNAASCTRYVPVP